MTTTLATAAPTFHALTGTQPVGQTQIATKAFYAGTLTSVQRISTAYWKVTTRETRDAFVPLRPASAMGASCVIWQDITTAQYVVDYFDSQCGYVEADRTRSLAAAIGVAADVTAERWLSQRAAR